MQNEKPDAKVPGGAEVRFKQGKPTRVDLTIEHFVDDWYKTRFVFDVDDKVATLSCIKHGGGSYWIEQNGPARRKAYDAVGELPIIDEVVRLCD